MTPKTHPEDMSKWSKEDFANQRTDNSTNQKCPECGHDWMMHSPNIGCGWLSLPNGIEDCACMDFRRYEVDKKCDVCGMVIAPENVKIHAAVHNLTATVHSESLEPTGRIQSDTKLDKAIESLVEDYGNALVALGKEEPDTKLQPGEEFIGDWITSDTIARVLISMEEFTEWVESHPAEAKYIVLVAQDKDGVYRNVKLEDF